jgi:hypothetical protein
MIHLPGQKVWQIQVEKVQSEKKFRWESEVWTALRNLSPLQIQSNWKVSLIVLNYTMDTWQKSNEIGPWAKPISQGTTTL